MLVFDPKVFSQIISCCAFFNKGLRTYVKFCLLKACSIELLGFSCLLLNKLERALFLLVRKTPSSGWKCCFEFWICPHAFSNSWLTKGHSSPRKIKPGLFVLSHSRLLFTFSGFAWGDFATVNSKRDNVFDLCLFPRKCITPYVWKVVCSQK